MNTREAQIYARLLMNPGNAYISLLSNEIYLLMKKEGMIVLKPIAPISQMTSTEIDQFITDSLKQILS